MKDKEPLAVLLANEFGRVERIELNDGLQGLRFFHQQGEGLISLYGGQVLTWQPKEQQPVFWLSRDSQYSVGNAIRGGVPLCWPWFGGEVKLANGDTSTAHNHGFARQSQWQIADIKLTSASVKIVLSLSGSNLSCYWPSSFKLSQSLVFGQSFQQKLTIKNLSNQAVNYTGALHSYFCVSDPKHIEIPALNTINFDDKYRAINNQNSILSHCAGPIDRIYHSHANMTIFDRHWQREIEVLSQGCQQWVLWNPGKVAEKMVDVHGGGQNEFICLEAANTDWQTIASQDSVCMSQTIKVRTKQ